MGLPFDFAFEGFRILKARPRLIAFWGAVSLFGYGLCGLIFIATFGPLQPMVAAYTAHPDQMPITDAMATQVILGFLMILPVYLVTSAVLNGAICRVSLEGGDDRLGYLRFGARELQILVVLAATLGMQFVVFYAVLTILSFLPVAGALAGARIVVALLIVYWLRVRLSLNVAQTFSRRRIDVLGSIALTRERFWPLAGGYLMAFGLAAIVDYLSEQIISAVVAIASGRVPSANVPDMSSLAAFLTVEHTASLILICSLVSPQITAIVAGAPVAAWRALTPAGSKVAIEV